MHLNQKVNEEVVLLFCVFSSKKCCLLHESHVWCGMYTSLSLKIKLIQRRYFEDVVVTIVRHGLMWSCCRMEAKVQTKKLVMRLVSQMIRPITLSLQSLEKEAGLQQWQVAASVSMVWLDLQALEGLHLPRNQEVILFNLGALMIYLCISSLDSMCMACLMLQVLQTVYSSAGDVIRMKESVLCCSLMTFFLDTAFLCKLHI